MGWPGLRRRRARWSKHVVLKGKTVEAGWAGHDLEPHKQDYAFPFGKTRQAGWAFSDAAQRPPSHSGRVEGLTGLMTVEGA